MVKKYFLQSINICLMVILILLLCFGLHTTGIVSNKKIQIIVIAFIIFFLVNIIFYFSKKTKLYNIGTFITLLINIIMAFEIYTINKNYDYLNNITNHQYEYKTYEIYVKKNNTTYNNINKLNGKKIGLLKENKENVEKHLNNLVKIEYVEYNTINDLCEGIKNSEIQAFVINDSNKENLKDNDLINKIRIIYSNKIKKNI